MSGILTFALSAPPFYTALFLPIGSQPDRRLTIDQRPIIFDDVFGCQNRVHPGVPSSLSRAVTSTIALFRSATLERMATPFRPVGLREASLIWDSGMRAFPPRLPHQPIFYPVANREYAAQIAKDWNAKDSCFAGYVTKFSVDDSHLAHYKPHKVGTAIHVEYWIPAEQLRAFNAAIRGMISLESAYFGTGFKGFIPDGFGLKAKDAAAQFMAMAKTWEYSRMDFVGEVSINRKAVYLNFLFWSQFDFTLLGVNQQRRDAVIEGLREAWDFNHIDVPLPAPRDSRP